MNLKDKIKTFPNVPGIYMMKDTDGNIIYVGKSKKLQDRIKSYFIDSKHHSRKNKRMIKNIFDIDIRVTDTELDALLLECEMIKSIRPIYNKLMKNHENYSYLKIDKSKDYPYIELVDKVESDGSIYFGPYTIVRKIEEIKGIINESYKLRSCNKMTKCFKYDIGKCLGPCRDILSKNEYNNIINIVINDLSGRSKELINILEHNMKIEINNLNFEKASKLKDNIDIINALFKRQNIINNSMKNEGILLWIKINQGYKIYIITKGKVTNSEILNDKEFEILNKEKYYYNKIKKYNLNKNKEIIVDKYEIDFINIIFSYIKYNKDISYIVLSDTK